MFLLIIFVGVACGQSNAGKNSVKVHGVTRGDGVPFVLPLVQLQVEQYESRCDTYLNLVGCLIGQSDPMPPEKQASLCLHLADLIRARSVMSDL